MKNKIFYVLIFAFALGFYTLSTFARIKQPVAMDDLNWLVTAKNLLLTGRPTAHFPSTLILAYSPHLYVYSIKWAYAFLGINESAARLPGILSGWIALFLVFAITQALLRNSKTDGTFYGALGALLYAATPAFIQGSVILDIDTTVVIPAVLFLVWSSVRYFDRQNRSRSILLGLAIVTVLWARITTGFLTVGLVYLYGLIGPGRKSSFQFKRGLTAVTACGIFGFLLSWFTYCQLKEVPFSMPFTYALDQFKFRTKASGGFKPFQFLENLIYLTLWLGPVNCLLFFIVALERLVSWLKKFEFGKEDIFLLAGAVIMGGYTFVGGTPFGFPKYQSAGVPLLCIFASLALHKNLHKDPSRRVPLLNLRNAFLLIASAFFIQLLAGDLLYAIRYELRSAFVFSDVLEVHEILKNIALRAVLYFALLTGLFALGLKRAAAKSKLWLLILLSLGSNMGMAWIQNSSSYQTGYSYGLRGVKEALQLIRRRMTPDTRFFVPNEIVYYLGLPSTSYRIDRLWNDPEEIRKILAESERSVFMYSAATNPVDQIKRFSKDAALQKLLREKFDEAAVGSFKIWIQRNSV